MVFKSFDSLIEILKKRKKDFTLGMELYAIYGDELYDSSKKWNSSDRLIKIREFRENPGHLNLLNCDRKSVNNIEEICKELENACLNNLAYITACSLTSRRLIYGCRLFVEQIEDNSVKKSMFEIFDIPISDHQEDRHYIKLQRYQKCLWVIAHTIGRREKENISYIPYRDSNLTRLMTNYLGGNSYSAMIFDNFEDVRILKMFGSIKNNACINKNSDI